MVKQGAWDNYIANNTAMDPGNMWSMNLDIESMGAPTTNTGSASQNQTQDGSNQQTPASVATSNPGQVFMGATTPGTGM